MKKVSIKRLKNILKPSRERVLIGPFIPQEKDRCYRIIGRIMSLSEQLVQKQLNRILADFIQRHHDIKTVLLRHFEIVRHWNITDLPLSKERQLLIGAFFTQEYSLESTALFNPSIVPHPDQSKLPSGSICFIMSLRATGEEHISSIVFREGIITQDFQVELKNQPPLLLNL